MVWKKRALPPIAEVDLKCVEIGNLKEEWGEVILEDLMNTNFKGHHDSDKLSNVIMDIINK